MSEYSKERPENLHYRKPAPKDLRALASGELEYNDQMRLRQRMLDSNDRAYDKALRTGWGMSRERAEDYSARYRRAILEASEQGERARSHRLRRELHEAERRAREASPRPGSYEHELALLRGGYRRDSTGRRSRR